MTSTGNEQRIKIVMVVQSLPPLPSGGAEIQALRLAVQLSTQGIDVMFITPGTGKLKGPTLIDGIPVYRLHSPLNYLLDLLFYIQKKSPPPKTVIDYDDNAQQHNVISRKIGIGARLRYLIFIFNALQFLKKRAASIDIIHSHTIEWPGYAAAVISKRLKKKLVVKDSTMNGIFNILRFPSGKKKQQLIINQAHFIAMTKVIRSNLLSAGVRPENITDIPNGISIEGPYKTDYQGATNVLFVGNLYQQPAKGIDILLKAWKMVLASLPDAHLDIAGDGDLDAYRQYCATLQIEKQVHFHGKHNDVPSLMLDTDVFVLPSRREGMPNVLMEAMLRGVPCIATDISGCQDLIDDGHTGLLVQPADISSLAEKIIYLLTHRNEAANMGIRARQKIIQHYNIDHIAEQYIKLYSR